MSVVRLGRLLTLLRELEERAHRTESGWQALARLTTLTK